MSNDPAQAAIDPLDEGGSFADLPDSPSPFDQLGEPSVTEDADGQIVIPDVAPDPDEGKPDPKPSPQPKVAAEPPRRSFMDEVGELERRKEMQAAQQQFRERWEKAWADPPRPEDPKQLVYDGEKLVAELDRRDRVWRERFELYDQATNQQFSGEMQRMAEQVWTTRAMVAESNAEALLANSGVELNDELRGEVEGIFRSDPERYWHLKSDPMSYVRAVQHIMIQRGQPAPQPGARTPAGGPRPRVGYTPTVPSGARRAGGPMPAALKAAVERGMGGSFKLRPEYAGRFSGGGGR